MNYPIVFFDGECGMCNRLVRFVQKRTGKVNVVSLQSNMAKTLLEKKYAEIIALNTIVLFENNCTFLKSEAIIRISKMMRGLWPLMVLFKIIPISLRDKFYDFIAHNRYNWFGRSETCTLNNT